MKSVRFGSVDFTPSKIICAGRNYVDHVREMHSEIPKVPLIFIKPNSAISHNVSVNVLESIHYEAELTFLILENRIAGLCVGLDLTKRALQAQLKVNGMPWERAKAFDGSAVLGNIIAFDGNFENLKLELSINQKRVQCARVADMIFPPQRLLESASEFLTIEDGDLLMTGTPGGVGQLIRNDNVEAIISRGDTVLVREMWVVS